jgi:hypothetical protein
LAYLDGFNSTNPTRDLWKWTMITQIIECITILTSCVPYLRPLLESLPSGMYGSDEIRRRGTPSELGYSRNKGGSYQLSSSNSHGTSFKNEKGSGIRSQGRKSQTEDGQMEVEIVALGRVDGEDKKWETDSMGSHSKILKTTVVSAEWEEAERNSKDMGDDSIEISDDR